MTESGQDLYWVVGNFTDIVEFLNATRVNWTLKDYVELTRGPKYLPISIILPLTIIYVIIFLTGVIGNAMVCLVIIKNRNLQSATNYYLFSLAVSDLLLLVLGLPNDLSVYWQQYPWQFGEVACKIRALASEMSSYTSVLTIVAFTTERYIAICRPLYSYTMSSLTRVRKIILALWILSLACALPFAAYTTVNYVDYPPNSGIIVEESAFCAMLDANIPRKFPIYEISTVLFFVVPCILIAVMYIKIARKLRDRNDYSFGGRVEGTIHSRASPAQSRKSIIRMLVAVVSMFFICWAPFHAQRLLYLYAKSSPYYITLNEWMYYITGALYFFSSTMNPIFYNLMSRRYRRAFKNTLFGERNKNQIGRWGVAHETTHAVAQASVRIRPSHQKLGPQKTVKTETVVQVNPQKVSNGKCVLSEKSGLFPKNLFMLPPSSLASSEQTRSSLKEGGYPLSISNHNTSSKETYI